MYQYVSAKGRACTRLLRRILARLSLKNVLFLAIGIFVSFYLFSALHTVSYVWQTTVLSSFISPIARTACVYNPSGDLTPKDVKIGLLMLYGNDNGAWGEDIMQAVIENRRQYAALHGYDIINANSDIDHSKPVAWSKLSTVEKHLDDYDYIMYIDMDVVIMEPAIKVESFIVSDRDIIMTEDWSGANTGMYMYIDIWAWSVNIAQAFGSSRTLPGHIGFSALPLLRHNSSPPLRLQVRSTPLSTSSAQYTSCSTLTYGARGAYPLMSNIRRRESMSSCCRNVPLIRILCIFLRLELTAKCLR